MSFDLGEDESSFHVPKEEFNVSKQILKTQGELES